MNGWAIHTGRAVALPVDNIDTDQLIPARFMSRPRAEGYGDLLLHDFRKAATGEENTDFVLNRFPQASVLISGSNFGTGSSREAAVYALVDAGIAVVVACSFGDIFTANAINNGLLPARISASDYRTVLNHIGSSEVDVAIDLSTLTLDVVGHKLYFNLDDAMRDKLINGWDDIDLTLNYADSVKAYRDQLLKDKPWVVPVQTEQ